MEDLEQEAEIKELTSQPASEAGVYKTLLKNHSSYSSVVNLEMIHFSVLHSAHTTYKNSIILRANFLFDDRSCLSKS